MDENLTILVKKADGSFIHVPLSQLQKPAARERQEKKPIETGSVLSQTIRKEPVRVAKLTEQIIPPKAVKPPEPAKHDLSSPLEEPPPKADSAAAAMPLLSPGREKQVEEIMKSLGFKVPAGNSGRLSTVIQLFLKDIRGERETIEILTRKEIEGGVGLSEGQAEEVVQKSKQRNAPTAVISTGAKRSGEIPLTGKRDSSTALGMTLSENARLEQEVPAVIKAMPVMQKPKTMPVAPPKASAPAAPKTEFKINTDRVKTTMSDVKAPMEYAPVDEIRYFSLTDFRRIAGNPTDAAARLRQKFMNLREESIILFFQALDAWRASPLYLDYLTAISESLGKRVPLTRRGDQTKIQLPEITALVQMEKDF